MAAFSFLAVSCQVEEQVYVPGEPDLEGCYGVYFPTQEAAGSHTMDPSETPAVEFVVKRLTEDGDITVPVEVKVSEEGIFNVPELKFVDGQTEAKLLVTFPNAVAGTKYSLSLEIVDPEYALVYGANPTFLNYSVIIERYDLMGTALYREDLLTALFSFDGDPNPEWEVEVYTKETEPGMYYLKNVYQPGVSPLFNPEAPVTDMYMIIDATNPQKVILPFQYLGCNLGYGECAAGSYAPEGGFNVSATAALYGTMINNVITFPVEGLLFGMSEYNDFGFYLANPSGMFRVALPGAVLTDYTISLEAGFASQGTQQVAFTFGPDVQTIKYAAFEGPLSNADIEAKAAEIAADANAQVVAKPAADAEGNVPAAVVGLSFEATGEYTIVAVGCDSEGTAQSSASLVIAYVAADDEVPVIVTAGLGAADKYVPQGFSPETAIEYYVYGQDLVDVKIGMFTAADFVSNQQGCVSALMSVPSEPAEVLEMINTDVFVDVMGGLTPGTEYYLLVWASNGYEQKIVASAPWTTAGDPLPVYAPYSIADINGELLPATSEGYFGTYNYYVRDWDENGNLIPLRDYRGQVTISDSEIPDSDPDDYGYVSEYVDVEGLVYYASQVGISEKVTFEYYDGVLYTINQPLGLFANQYYIYLYSYDPETGGMYNASVLGGFVDEGYIAFVNAYASQGYNICALLLAAFADENYSQFLGGGVDALVDILLVDPEVDDNGLAPMASSKMSTMSMSDLKRINSYLSSEINYVETERGRIHSSIDRANAIKTVGQAAGVQGEYNAQPAAFSAVEAAPVYNSNTTDFSRINDATPALYR